MEWVEYKVSAWVRLLILSPPSNNNRLESWEVEVGKFCFHLRVFEANIWEQAREILVWKFYSWPRGAKVEWIFLPYIHVKRETHVWELKERKIWFSIIQKPAFHVLFWMDDFNPFKAFPGFILNHLHFSSFFICWRILNLMKMQENRSDIIIKIIPPSSVFIFLFFPKTKKSLEARLPCEHHQHQQEHITIHCL